MSNEEKTEVQGPRRKAPPYYIGETYRGYRTAPPDVERYKNGAMVGKRNKAARRLIRKTFGRQVSSIEKKILKARDVRLEVERLATNSHEARRYFKKTLALHQPLPPFVSRSEARKANRQAILDARDAQQELRVKRAEALTEKRRKESLASTEKTLADALDPNHPMMADEKARATHDLANLIYGVDPGYKDALLVVDSTGKVVR